MMGYILFGATALLATLKLCGVISIPWLWVFVPVLFIAALWVIALVVMGLVILGAVFATAVRPR